MVSLRQSIQDAIESAGGDARKAAIAVCLVLEEEVGLAGNGWFDGDEIMEIALSEK